MTWLWIGLTSVGCYLLKLLGIAVPPEVLESDRVRRVVMSVPAAFFGGLVVSETVTSGQTLVVDARLAGLAAAAIALMLRAPFLLVLVVSAVVTAAVRALA